MGADRREKSSGPPPVHPAPGPLRCIRCGYSLDGLPPGSLCPECATPVVRSLQGDLLRYSPPEHLRSLRSGARIILYGLPVWLAARGGDLVVLGLVNHYEAWPRGTHPWTVKIEVLTGGVLLAVLLGWWRLSERDATSVVIEPVVSGRRLLRALVVPTALATVLDRGLAFGGVAGYGGLSAPFWLALAIAAPLHMLRVARRIPADELRVVAIMTLIVTGILLSPCAPVLLFMPYHGALVVNVLILAMVATFAFSLGRIGAPEPEPEPEPAAGGGAAALASGVGDR